jgi:uncharacterized protein YkwD
VIVIWLVAFLAVVPAAPVAAALMAPLPAAIPAGGAEAVEARLRERLAALRAEAGVPPLGRMTSLDSAARARAEEIAALPMGKRLGHKEPIASLLRSHGIRRYERAEARVAILAGYDDPAAEALAQWADGPESRLLDRRWTAAGAAAAAAPDGVLVIVALMFQETAIPPDLRALERAVERAVNEVRTARGLKPLAASGPLREVARAHSQDMARRGYFAHASPEGRGPVDRVLARGLAYRKVSENIAMSRGEDDPVRSAVDGWVASPGHRENLLDPGVRETGVGIAVDEDGALYFTQLFFDALRP